MTDKPVLPMTKRDLLTLIGKTAGASAMYMAMSSLGAAHASPFKGPIKLDGDVKGASVLILGAGVAGMVAALELRRAGYKVQVLEYNDRVGGRSWTLKGGDSFTELGGATQTCQFSPGNYINPGPWRIPHHHHGLMHYCHELGVALEPFMQLNYSAYCHNTKAFGGKPQRYATIQADYYGHVSELLAKAVNQQALGDALTKEDGEILLQSLKNWGALDKDYRYVNPRQPPLIRIDRPRLAVAAQYIAAQRRFGARERRVQRPSQDHHIPAVLLADQRGIAGRVRSGDHHHHCSQECERRQSQGKGGKHPPCHRRQAALQGVGRKRRHRAIVPQPERWKQIALRRSVRGARLGPRFFS